MDDNLWGKISLNTVTTPKSILQKQAYYLEKKTGGKLTGQVYVHAEGDIFKLYFNIVVPALDNYSFRLLDVEHEVTLYPLHMTDYANSYDVACHNEQDFVERLRVLLSSEKVAAIIKALLSQLEDGDIPF